MAELIVTNLNRNFTGVSATAAGVVRQQATRYDMALAGHALPGAPDPVTLARARALSRAPGDRPFAIWHVRRNPEMRHGIWARDVLHLPIRLVFTSAAQRRHSAYPRWLISRMDAVIATTEAAATYVPHVRAVVPHGVDTDRWVPAADRATAWAETGYGGTAGVACIGRIRPEKGTDRFVETMLQVLPHRPGLTALVIGRAGRQHQAFAEDLRARVAAAGLSERLLFPGEIPADRLPTVMRGLSALVALPRYEGYGMTPLEAMASGVPFVATDTGHFRAFDGGSVVPNDEGAASAASDALGALLDDVPRWAKGVRRRAVTAYGIAREVEGIGAVYDELWEGRQ
ncbi:glycosyl transferase family 1 [Jannaschia pagri]|uniref:Glycosyl transferase family 1 n=1 Tax=Jannaschia pagri TaxID=2829797 RepID=A0ABQ4NQ54_9RHOB|nr:MULTISPECIES: glycosyltransferase family 4 protein [unclassified Jannaschia]GIT92596.1 glycosyl transferase family 1 [Jannaschia sp. AI_61]GIT96544.1 glycosyl transferase family 1 [Jannaschia sp. AI_62]